MTQKSNPHCHLLLSIFFKLEHSHIYSLIYFHMPAFVLNSRVAIDTIEPVISKIFIIWLNIEN